jgi:hypothetical protein
MLHCSLRSNSARAQAGIRIRHTAQVRRRYRGEMRLKGALGLGMFPSVAAVEVAGVQLQLSRKSSWRRTSQWQIRASMDCCWAREVLEAAGAGVGLRLEVQRSWWWRGWHILPRDNTPRCSCSDDGGGGSWLADRKGCVVVVLFRGGFDSSESWARCC